MGNTRSIKELLQLILYEFEYEGLSPYTGMCECIFSFLINREISEEEYRTLRIYLKSNCVNGLGLEKLWFPQYEKPPRIEWLKKHIELNSK